MSDGATPMFDIDWNTYELVDLSYEVQAGQGGERPFLVSLDLLADGSYKYNIQTHSHVGSHVEFPRHFFGMGAKDVTDYPPAYFMGRAVLCRILKGSDLAVRPGDLEAEIGDIIRPEDIVVFRNDGPRSDDVERLPYFTPAAAHWLRSHQVKLIVLDSIRLGADVEGVRAFHEILMGPGAEVPFVEFVSNLDALTQREFYLMCPPYKVRGLDSSFCRVLAILERSPRTG
ncbi:MAG: cyclase family protein [Anaerolineae bacterium]